MTETSFTQPKTLKECLQLMAKLGGNNDWGLRQNVRAALKGDLENYCYEGGEYLKNFGLETESAKGNFASMFEHSKKLLGKMFSASVGFGNYNTLQTDCVEEIATALRTWLPQVYSALYFLYFMTSENCSSIGGGQWNDKHLTGSSELNKWLKGEIGKEFDFMDRNFVSGDFRANSAKMLVEPLSQLVKHTAGGDLQWVLSGMMFFSDWSVEGNRYALTGHACMFLYEFCKQASNQDNENKLRSQFQSVCSNGKWNEFKNICKDLKDNLDKCFGFTKGTSGLYAVCQRNHDLYSGLLNLPEDAGGEKFTNYLEWLKTEGILDRLIISFNRMSMDCSNWNREFKESSDRRPLQVWLRP